MSDETEAQVEILEAEEEPQEEPQEEPAKEIARAIDGRWLPGVSGNRMGRPPKRKEERFVRLIAEEVSDEDVRAIIRRAVEDAKEGNRWARDWLWQYAVGKPKVMPRMGPEEAPVVTLMKLWVAQASGDKTMIEAMMTQLVGTVPE